MIEFDEFFTSTFINLSEFAVDIKYCQSTLTVEIMQINTFSIFWWGWCCCMFSMYLSRRTRHDRPEQCFPLDQQVLTTSGYSVAGMLRQGEGGATVPTLTQT